MDARLIEKRWQLTASERGVHWGLSKQWIIFLGAPTYLAQIRLVKKIS
jgi:hypothetical protein